MQLFKTAATHQGHGEISTNNHFIRRFISPQHVPFTSMEGGNNVLVRDKSLLRDKLERLKRDGSGQFEIMTDFDMTLTRYFYVHESSA